MRLEPWCALSVILLAGCGIPVPSYTKPKGPTSLEPGFHDFAQQSGRWLCELYDFVRVNTATGTVLVEMNNDYVIREQKAIAGGGTEYTLVFSDMFLGGDGTTTTFRLLAPPRPEEQLVLITEAKTKSTGATVIHFETVTVKQLCMPVPAVTVLR